MPFNFSKKFIKFKIWINGKGRYIGAFPAIVAKKYMFGEGQFGYIGKEVGEFFIKYDIFVVFEKFLDSKH